MCYSFKSANHVLKVPEVQFIATLFYLFLVSHVTEFAFQRHSILGKLKTRDLTQ